MIRILLVDDQKATLEALNVELSEEPDFTVVGTASDGNAAIEQAHLLNPDLVLMDLEMPILDGIDATQVIHQKFPHIKVLMLSGHDDQDRITRSLQAGAMGYVLRKTPLEELKQEIRFVAQGYTHISREVLNKVIPSLAIPTSPESSRLAAPVKVAIDTEVFAMNGSSKLEGPGSNPHSLAKSEASSTAIKPNPAPLTPVKALPKKRRLGWLAGLLALGLIAGSSYTVYSRVIAPRRAASSKVETVPIERTDLQLSVSANGVVRSERSINVSPKNAGVLQRLLVQEGDQVQKGDTIAIMDDSNLRGQLTQAQGQLAAAQATLNKLLAGTRAEDLAQAEARVAQAEAQRTKVRNGGRPEEVAQAETQVESARAQLDLAQIRTKRFQQLANDGAISQDRLDEVLTNERNAQATFNQAQEQLEQVKRARPEDIALANQQLEEAKQALRALQNGPRSEEIDQARAQVLSAQGAVQSIQSQLNDTVVRAPYSGTIIQKTAEEGSLIVPARPVLATGGQSDGSNPSSIVTLASAIQVVANVAESNIAQMKLNQDAAIEADAYPRQKFSGRVIQVANQSVVVQNVTSFEVKVQILSDPKQQLQPGMNVDVVFQTGKLDNVMTIPTVAILRQAAGTGVYVEGPDQKPIFKPLVTGVTVGAKTVVESGLNGNERVFISFPEGFRPTSNIPGIPR
jgi:HlyD family secretion protein